MLRITFTILYHILFGFFLCSGINVLVKNPKNKINIIYFSLCISFAVWAEGLGLCNATLNPEIALFWRKFAALGWGTTFTILLHFLLEYGRYYNFLKKKRVLIIYIPAIINIFSFSLFSPIASNQYSLILTELGWTNQIVFTPLDIYFRITYIINVLFSVLIMFLIYRKNSKKGLQKLIVENMIVVISIIFLVNLTDYFFKKIYEIHLLSVEPFYMLIGLFFLRAFIDKNDTILTRTDTNLNEKVILTTELRSGFYKNIGFIFQTASIFMFFSVLKDQTALYRIMITSLIFIIIGTIIRYSSLIIKSRKIQDLFLIFIMSLSILQMAFRTSNLNYKLDFLWILPIIYLIIITVFESKLLSAVIFFSAVFFQSIIAFKYPNVNIEVNYIGYIGRIGFYFIAFFLHSYIRDIFMKRKKELETTINKLKQTENKVKQLAYYDSLTDLPNRFNCHKIIKENLVISKELNSEFTIMFLDLDAFKGINDGFGHSKGDLILVETAKRLKSVVKYNDSVARLGGDEFVIVLKKTGKNYHPEKIAVAIIEEIAKPFFLGKVEVFLGVSIGIVTVSKEFESVEEILMKADSAMYRAKELGKNRYCYYSKEISDKNMENLEMESKIKKSLMNNNFELYIQPKIKIIDKNFYFAGGEALIRLHETDGSLLTPIHFIKVAEDRSLIVPLGYWVIHEACKIIRNLNDKNIKMSLAINVSVKQFSDKNFISSIIDALEYFNVSPSQLEIEITESIFKGNIIEISDILKKIQNLGIKIAIDDFGTGYSSLNLLGTLPIDSLKIDKSFTAKLGIENEKEIVSTIIDLAENLSLETVVEGVETKEQVEILAEKYEDIILQGYYFSKPLTLKKFIEFYENFMNNK